MQILNPINISLDLNPTPYQCSLIKFIWQFYDVLSWKNWCICSWTGVPSNHLTSRTIMVDPHGNVYLVNDRVRNIGVISPDMWNKPQPVDIATPYLLNFPSDHNHTTDPESGDISPDGTQVLILTYNHIYYWHVQHGNILLSLQGVPIIVPRLPNHHLGGVCWDLDGRNYYTVKEGKNAPFYIHRRINWNK